MTHPYAGAAVVVASRHGKAALVRPSFARVLGARVVSARGIDTDQFGTFTGDIPRTLAPIDAARAKAQLALDRSGAELALASEASYRSLLGPVGEHHELLLFRDARLDVTVTERAVVSAAVGSVEVTDVAEAVRVAERWGFPRVGVAVIGVGVIGERAVRKSARNTDEFGRAVTDLLGSTGSVRLERDYRAHRNPARRLVIRELADRLAHRLDTPCPECGCPGWGRLAVLPGAPCADCGEPTRRPRAEVHGCPRCTHRVDTPIPGFAGPDACDACNP